MAASERFKSWVEAVAESWKDRLKGWLVNILSFGFETFFDVLGKSFSPKLTPLVSRLTATGQVPPELKPLLDEITNPTGEIGAMISQSAGSALIGGALGKIVDAIFLPLAYTINRQTKNVLPDQNILLAANLRGLLSDSDLDMSLASLGYDTIPSGVLKGIRWSLFNPDQAIGLWRRGKMSDSDLARELKSQGLNDNKIEGAKILATILPSASDIIRFAIREVYTPEIAQKFGQFEDFPTKAMDDAKTIGFSEDLLKKYWAAHWELPAANQGFEMLHRGIISYDELKVLLRALDVMPFWRDKLIQVAYNPYTRVDARRMWDMGVLNDEQLKKAYLEEGYDDTHANNLVVWTKVYQTFPDIIARYKNGYINLEDVSTELKSLGVTDQIADWLISTKIKKAQPERVAKERDLTKAEIIKGLYKGVIDEPTATQLLMDMGYDANEAKFIIVINMPKEDTKAAKSQKELTKTDILNGLKRGVLSEADAISRLVAIRYTPEDATYLVQITQQTKETITETPTRELTKTEIIKGVKQGLITIEEGYLMLQDIGYAPEDAAFILTISIPAIGGSPDSFADFKAITQSYRVSQGLSAKPVPIDLQQAERDMIAAKAALDYTRVNAPDSPEIVRLEQNVNNTTLAYKTALSKYMTA